MSSISRLQDTDIGAALAPFGVRLNAAQMAQVREYIRVLLQWNQKISLTSVVDPSEVLARHFGESMFAVQFLDSPDCRLSDIGSGAGFPGLAIKLLAPGLEVILVEANQKKAAFLSHVISVLQLDRATVTNARYEALPISIPSFDVICCRAVGKLSSLLQWAERSLSAAGQVILWLGEADARSVVMFPGWSWQPPVPVPRSNRRFLSIGRRISY